MPKRKIPGSQRTRPARTPPRYEVGYGKPPKQTRFQPGHSGNPKGRPKGARAKSVVSVALKSLLLEEAHRLVSISDPSGQTKMSLLQAALRILAINAAQGNPAAQRIFFPLLASVEADNQREQDEQAARAPLFTRIEWVIVDPRDQRPNDLKEADTETDAR